MSARSWSPAAGDDSFNPRSPYAVREAVRALHHDRLSRGVRPTCQQWILFKPRVRPAGRHVRHAQGDARCGGDLSPGVRNTSSWEPDGSATGDMRRSLSRLVADAPAARARTISSSRPARRIRSVSSARSHSGVGRNSERHVRIDEQYFRPTEVEALRVTPRRRSEPWLGARTKFQELVRLMLEARSGRGWVDAGVLSHA